MKKGNGMNGFDHRPPAESRDAQSQEPMGELIGRILSDILGRELGDIGHVPERRDRPEDALLLFQRAVEMTPANPRAWYNLGDTLLALRRYDEAQSSLERSVELGAGGWLVHYDLALALYHLGQFERAASLFQLLVGSESSMKRAPANPVLNALTNLALCYGEMGLWPRAVSTLGPALSHATNTLHNIGRFHLRDGKHAEARRYLVMAAELEPGSEDLLHAAGTALMNLREWEGSRPLFAPSNAGASPVC